MSNSSNPPPSREQEVDLHRRLLNGDPTASADLAEIYFDLLVNWVVDCNSKDIDEHLCFDAATEAFCSLIKNPASYDPAKKRLMPYLQMSAQGDLRNLMRREERHRTGRQSLEFVEHSEKAQKYIESADDPSNTLQLHEAIESVRDNLLPFVREDLTDGELRVLELMLRGERKTEIFAKAYGIAHLSTEQKRIEIKRVKDKLKKRIERKT